MKLKFVLLCLLGFSLTSTASEKLPAKKEITSAMTRVCDWQLANLIKTEYMDKDSVKHKNRNTNWIRGTFLTGINELYNTTHESKYLDSAMALCSRNNWKLGPNFQHADDLCIGQAYIELYKLKKDKEMIAEVEFRLNAILKNPKRGPVVGWKGVDNWDWCDALYMAPPVFSRMYSITKNQAYLDTMTVLWFDTYNLLYDKKEKLFYRDSRFSERTDGTQKLSINGKKIFWSRGNGWVIGGLTRLLQDMPKNYKSRAKFETAFKEMSARIASLQGKDGLWRSSLLDTEEYPAPETSGSGFYCYALAYGINNGLLSSKTYLPVVLKAWKGLNWAIDKNSGMLGWVQAVGADPRSVTATESQEYGAGAFLLAGSEMIKINKNKL
ncbi:MAG: glycoside hydrolase family 88 protein [Paludibacter sp.]